MNITNNNSMFSSSLVSLFKGRWPIYSTHQENKILYVVCCALGILATLYLVRKYCRSGLNSSDKLAITKERKFIDETLMRVKHIGVLPENKEITTENGVYQSPRITMLDLNKFFESYAKKNDYAGLSFSMGTNKIYDKTFTNKFFTAVYFKKNETFGDYGISTLFMSGSQSKSWEARKNELEELVFPMIDTWGYSSMQIGNVNEEFFSGKQTHSDYELYLLLFYKEQ